MASLRGNMGSSVFTGLFNHPNGKDYDQYLTIEIETHAKGHSEPCLKLLN